MDKAMRTRPSRPQRVCAEGGCSTVLSIYNGAAYCWVHEPPTFRPKPGLVPGTTDGVAGPSSGPPRGDD
jgi:hypothetical protein